SVCVGRARQRKGEAVFLPSLTTHTLPPCSTTNSRPLPSPALVTNSGFLNPSATVWRSIRSPAGEPPPPGSTLATGLGDEDTDGDGDADTEAGTLGVALDAAGLGLPPPHAAA